MALFVATKARLLVTVATAGAMVAGVAGLQAEALQAESIEVAAEAQASQTVAQAPTPTATSVVKKKKKKKKPAAVYVAPAPTAEKKTPAKNHGSSSGSK
jgi:hypothetical protein